MLPKGGKGIVDLSFLNQPCSVHLSVKEVFRFNSHSLRQAGVNLLCIGFLQFHRGHCQRAEGQFVLLWCPVAVALVKRIIIKIRRETACACFLNSHLILNTLIVVVGDTLRLDSC